MYKLAQVYVAILREGCYDDVAMFSGVVQHYIPNLIVGGRCMTSNSKMYHVNES